jgi:adenosylcobinamide kinase / adenosylcobinamide-phosphate guanylyltransferase
MAAGERRGTPPGCVRIDGRSPGSRLDARCRLPGITQWLRGKGSPPTVAGAAAALELVFRTAFPVGSPARDHRSPTVNGRLPTFVNVNMTGCGGRLLAPQRDKTGGARLTLVLGGARSGKSRYAETLVMAVPPPWTYVATAVACDAEMAARIADHRRRRGEDWHTVEAPNDLAPAIDSAIPGAVLVDCLTLWLTNRMLADADIDAEFLAVEAALGRRTEPVVLVSNEVGSGIVPDNALGRRFRDLQGVLNQRLAARAGRVVLLVAGLPLEVKPSR